MNSAVRLLKNADNILIICHVRPDGDTLGSAFALKEALEYLNKRVCVACDTPVTNKYLFVTENESELKVMFNPDFVVAVDIANISLMGDSLMEYADRIDLSIDHHPTNGLYAKTNIVNEDCASTGEIVYDIIKQLGCPLTKTIVNNIYVAVSTDTGCFRYSNTTAKTLRVAAQLIENGAENEKLNKILFETFTPSQVLLQGLAIKTLRFYCGGSVAIIKITLDLIKEADATDDDIDNLSNLPINIAGVDVGLTIREIGPGEYKISARSNENVDVSYICSLFGGGGHKRAAGCMIYGTIEEAEANLINAIVNYRSANID